MSRPSSSSAHSHLRLRARTTKRAPLVPCGKVQCSVQWAFSCLAVPACALRWRTLLRSWLIRGWRYPSLDGQATPATASRTPIGSGGNHPSRDRIVAIDDGTVVGALHVEDGWLSFFVRPSHWRMGVGRAMLGFLAVQSGAAAGRMLSARVYRENMACTALLEASGFRFAGLGAAQGCGYAMRAQLVYHLPARCQGTDGGI